MHCKILLYILFIQYNDTATLLVQLLPTVIIISLTYSPPEKIEKCGIIAVYKCLCIHPKCCH